MPPDTDTFDWEQLLEGIKRGSVVPVVGRDLLQIEIGDRKIKAGSYLAEKLL
jgi:hypothetical protein